MPKKIPQRMCVICRTMHPKDELLRIVRGADGIFLDVTGKRAGRGAYVCNNAACIEKCVKKKVLNKIFNEQISDEVYEEIQKEYARFTENK